MNIDTLRAKAIQDYINTHEDCKIDRWEPVELEGEVKRLEVLKLPTNILFYNIRNGRFAAELIELEKRTSKILDPKDLEDSKTIRKMLLELSPNETEYLEEDLKRVGQLFPGIITFDGAVINGNRRMAVLENLYEKEALPKWKFLTVVRLPKSVEDKDLWRLEAGLQLSRDYRLEYGPINELLKYREGKVLGLTPKEISMCLFGNVGPEEIKEKLNRLKLIEDYLDYIGKPGYYKEIDDKRIHEHFIDIQTHILKPLNGRASKKEISEYLEVCFNLINQGVRHYDIRDVKKILNEKSGLAKQKAFDALQALRQGKISQSDFRDKIILDAIDYAKVAEDSGKPKLLLERAWNVIQSIEHSGPHLKDVEVIKLLSSIKKRVEALLAVK